MAKEEATTNNGGEIMLFGFRVVVDSMRKSVSLNNLSQYQHHLDSSSSSSSSTNDVVPSPTPPPGGYASADDNALHRSSNSSRERKRGVPWTEEEHKLFLLGLQKVGKGDWRGISRNFVKTRTPTQVASHAQKYFLRRSNFKSKGRRRSSLFDITTDTVTVNQQQINNGASQSPPPPLPPQPQQEAVESVAKQETRSRYWYNEMVDNHEMKIVSPEMATVFDLNKDDDSLSLSLNLSLAMQTSSFQVIQGHGDSRISVA